MPGDGVLSFFIQDLIYQKPLERGRKFGKGIENPFPKFYNKIPLSGLFPVIILDKSENLLH
jgi:hypothetical protein